MIQVDDRIGSRELAGPLRQRGLPVEVTRLEYADVSWLGNGPGGLTPIGAERKKLDDLLSCITSDRFSGHQLPGLLDCYEVVYLVVEGIWKCGDEGELLVLKHGGWRSVPWGKKVWLHRQVSGFLTTMAQQAGLVVEHTSSEKDTVRFLHEQYGWWTGEEWSAHRSMKALPRARMQKVVLRRPKDWVERIRVQMLAQLLDVGYEKAWAVYDHFGSVKRAAEATPAEWQKIKGIGEVIAEKALRVLA